MIDETTLDRFHNLTRALIRNNLTISTMESCSGGLIGALLSDLEGASDVVKGGFFTYSNEAKISCGVAADVIDTYGVYSLETAREMARVCRESFGTDIGIGVTGSIGTIDPNNADSVPGEVYIAVDINGDVRDQRIELAPASRLDSRLAIADKIADLLSI